MEAAIKDSTKAGDRLLAKLTRKLEELRGNMATLESQEETLSKAHAAGGNLKTQETISAALGQIAKRGRGEAPERKRVAPALRKVEEVKEEEEEEEKEEEEEEEEKEEDEEEDERRCTFTARRRREGRGTNTDAPHANLYFPNMLLPPKIF